MNDEHPSKTQRKKAMHELQALGAELLDLNERDLAAVDLPENLRDALQAARRMTKFEARRRQLQYIGKLMRTVDAGPIREHVQRLKAVSVAHTARLHQLERWRTRLLEDENALGELIREYPRADAARVRTLVRNVRHEREAGQAPRSFRALFHLLEEITGGSGSSVQD